MWFPDRLGAQVKLGGDLLSRAALLRRTKRSGPDSAVKSASGAERPSSGRSSIKPNTPTTRFSLVERRRVEASTGTRVPSGRDEVAGRLAGRGGAEHLLERIAGGHRACPRARRRRR